MTGSMALRLFWKEYRTHRGLWLSAAIGTLVLHGLLRAMTDRPTDLEEALWMISACLTGCFAAGAAAVTFAVEREDGTHLRLLSMSPSPTLTFVVKVAAIAGGCAALAASTGLSALLISTRWYPTTEVDTLSFPGKAVLWIAAAIALCMFFSVLLRHVFAALLAGALSTVVSMMAVTIVWENTALSFQHQLQHGIPDAWYWRAYVFNGFVACVIGVVFAVDLFLVRRWLNRGFFDDRPSRIRMWIGRARVRRASVQGGVTVEVGVESDLSTPVLTPEEAAIQPPPRVSLSWLHLAPGRRTVRPFRFLRWKEAIETRIPVLIGAAVVAVLTVAAIEPTPRSVDLIHAMLLFGIPAIMGLMSFRAEQRHARFRLLGELGLSPRAVWLSKHAVWGPRTIGLMLLVFGLTAANYGFQAWSRLCKEVYTFQENAFRVHYSEFSRVLLGETPEVRCMIVSLLMYGIGQWASLTYRRGVIAVFVVILGMIVTGVWLVFCTAGGIPIVLSVLPVIPALFMFSWLRTSSWIIDRNEKRVWLKPGLVLVAGLASCVLLPASYRVLEVPPVTVQDIERPPMTTAGVSAFTSPLTEDEKKTAQLYHTAFTKVAGGDPTTWPGDSDELGRWIAVTDKTHEWVAANQTALELLHEAASRESCAFRIPGDLGRAAVPGAVPLLLRAGLVEADEGRVDDALDRFEAALNMHRHLAGRGGDVDDWTMSRLHTNQVLKAMSWWGTRPEVKKKHIKRAEEIIRKHLGRLPSIAAAEFGQHEYLRRLVAAGPSAILGRSGFDWRYDYDPTHRWLYRFPGESTRKRKIVNHSDSTQAGLMIDLSALDLGETMPNLRQSYLSLKQKEGLFRREIDRWQRTTPTLRRILAAHVTGLTRRDIETRTEAAATLVMMHLFLAERRDGVLPRSLESLPDDLNDPWTGQPFAWYPDGLPQEMSTLLLGTIQPHRPFLFSGGPRRGTIVRHEFQVYEDEAEGMGTSSAMEAGTVGPAEPEGFSQPAPPVAGEGGQQEPAEPDVETVVEYTIQYESGDDEAAAAFLLPRPKK